MKTSRDTANKQPNSFNGCRSARGKLASLILPVWLAAPCLFAGQGTPSYIDFDDVNPGFGTPADTSETSLNWTTSAAGSLTATARPSGTQMTIGSLATDFGGTSRYAFSINLNGGGNLQGVVINSTNVDVTFTGSANTHNNSGPNTWFVTNYATLTVNDTRQTFSGSVKGMNWNNVVVTFRGAGTINFPTPFGCNSTTASGPNVEDMAGGTINLQMAPVTAAGTYTTGFTLNNGALNFASAGSANAFNGFAAGKFFTIAGGTIDNTSGSPMVLSVGNGAYTLSGDFNFTGSSSLDFGPAGVTLTGNRIITVNGSTLTLGAMTGPGFSLTKAGAGTLALSGANTYTGTTTVTNGSTLALTGAGNLASSALVVSGSTLDVSSVDSGMISTPSLSITNAVMDISIASAIGTNIAAGTLNLGGSLSVNITSFPLVEGYPTTYHLISCGSSHGSADLNLASLPSSPNPYVAHLSSNADGSLDLVLTAGPAPVHPLSWNGLNGSTPDGTWDVGTTPTWLNAAHTATVFSDMDLVTFNDTAAGATSVNMMSALAPGSLTVSNSSKTFTLGGGGKITGDIGLLKQGTGTLILDESGGNDFTGGIIISAGTLQVGNNDGFGNVPSVGDIVDNGALVFDRNDYSVITNTISGTGSVAQNAPGTLTLLGANTFSGAVTVAQGTLIIGNSSALGTTNGGTTIASGATLDFGANANNLGQEPVTVSGAGVGGAGALVNNSGSTSFVGPNIARVTLAGDTTFGGTGRWDLRSANTADPTQSSLSTGGVARKLTKVGGNDFHLVGATVDPALGDIDVQGGIFGVEAATTSLGNTASNLTIDPGATLQLFALTNQLNKVITLGGDGAATSLSATSGSNTIVGPMGITNDVFVNVSSGVSLSLNNVLTGVGRINKIGPGMLSFDGASLAYAGGIQMNGGTIAVNGSLAAPQGVTLTTGTLNIRGTIAGGVTNSFGSIIAGWGTNTATVDVSGTLNPGDTGVAGTLTLGPLVLEPGATVNFDLSSLNGVGGGTNDLIVVNGDLTINGNTINLVPRGLLQVGMRYRLFNYTGHLIWNGDLSFQDQSGLNYTASVDTNTAGQVNFVIASGGPPVWTGGSSTSGNWSDSANWHAGPISPGGPGYFAGNTRLNATNDLPADNTFGEIGFAFGAGSFVLRGNPIIPTSDIVNLSSNPQTIDLGLDFGSSFLLNGGTAGLTLGGGLTNTASGFTTVTLAGTGTITNLLASVQVNGTNTLSMTNASASWTLVDNAASAPMTNPWPFDILAGVFNFGTPTSAPVVSSTSANGLPQDNRVGNISGAVGTFNMVNGILTTVARLNTATVVNSTGIVNQVGGTLNIGQQFQGANGANAGEMSIVNLSGGTMNIGGGSGQFYLASRGMGVLTVSDSGALNCGVLDLSRSIVSGTVGTVNLNGGVITASRVGTATANQTASSTGSTAAFNFNSGTLRASGSSATFFQGSIVAPIIPIVATVKAGGAVIDSGTNAISVLEPLQHDTNLGATADGGLTKLGTGTLTLTAANTYTGPTLVNAGTLAVNGSLAASPVTVADGGTLAGTGTLAGNVTVSSGGSIAPGGAGTIGALTIAGSLSLQGTTIMEVNKSLGTKDLLVAANIAYSGTLSVTNLAGSLSVTDTFKLFNAGGYTGGFTSISPTTPGPGLAWDTSKLNVSGTLGIIPGVNTTPTNVTAVVNGNQLTLSWPSDHTGWILQMQVDPPGTGLGTNWVNVAGSSSTNQISVTIDPSNGSAFYRLALPQ